jgi:excisionase family DNA binding protein
MLPCLKASLEVSVLSPQKAANQAGVSRKTIMDQIHAQKLNATRNNHNRWQITEEDLQAWLDSRANTKKTVTSPDTYADTLKKIEKENVALKVSLEAAERLVAELKEDREHWRQQANRLLTQQENQPAQEQPKGGFWKRLFG